MDVQSAANLNIPEGSVRNIHDKDKRLLWSAVGYNVRYDGDTTQQTYTGKNIFCVANTKSFNGVSLTHNPDGSFSLSGQTSSTKAEFSIRIPLTPMGGVPGESVTYTTSVSKEFPEGLQVFISARSSSAWVQDLIQMNKNYGTSRTQTKTLASNISLLDCIIRVEPNTAIEFSNVKVQVEKSSSPTTFEPYVGGYPAPNPDYPQDVNVVKGEQTILVSGRNLMKVPSGTSTSNGITWVRDGNSKLHGSGTLVDYSWSNTGSGIVQLNLPPGTYTFSIKEPLPSPLQVEFSTYDNNNTRINYQIPVNNTSTTRNFPNGLKSAAVATVRGVIGNYYDVTIKNVQVEAGSTVTAFEQPQSKTVNFDLRGKNLFDNTKSEAYISKASFQTIPNGIRAITTTDSTGAAFAVMIVGKVEDFLGDKITLSYSSAVPSSSNHVQVYIGLCDANGNNRSAKYFINATENGVGTYNIGNTVDSTRPYLCLAFYSSTTTATTIGDYVDYNNVQLEIGDAATTYQPYHAPIELCKIGNYQDYIYKGADGWYVHKETGKHTFTGSEGWGAQSNYDTANRKLFGFNALNSINGDDVSSRLGVCSEFSYVTGLQNSSVDVTGFQFNTGASYSKWVYVKIEKDLLPTQDAQGFKNWLSSHNMTIYYQMSPAIDTKITDATLISQLNAIHDWLRRYDYYGAVSGNLPIIINRSGII